MTARDVLREAKHLVTRAHTPTQLAVDARGVNVRPVDPSAVAWSSTGAIGKVAPGRSIHDEKVWFDHTEAGYQAWLLLNEAARLQGHPGHTPVINADRAGLPAVLRVFDKALQLTPDADRRSRRGSPRGAAA